MMTSPAFLMSPPRHDWRLRGKQNFRSRQGGEVDAAAARREWERLADAIVAAGGRVLVCPPHPGKNLTGMIYTAEAGELYRGARGQLVWLMPNVAAPHRVEEADWIGGFFAGLGVEVASVEATWEAQGDALRVDRDRVIHTYGVGPDARTSAAAYAEVAARLSSEHLHLEFVAAPWFHGNTFLNVYRGREVIALACREAMPAPSWEALEVFLGDDVALIEITREESLAYATNALQVRGVVLAPAGISPRFIDLWRSIGLDVEILDLSQLFSRGGGAPVCLTNRLWALEDGELANAPGWWRQKPTS